MGTDVADDAGTAVLARVRAAVADGRAVAPAHARVGVRVTEVDPGVCAARMTRAALLRDPAGRLDVGGLLVLADAVLGLAISSVVPVGRRIATLHLGMSTVSTEVPEGGVVVARARLRALSPDNGLSSGTIEDATGRLLARVSTRCAVLAGEVPIAPAGDPFAGIPIATSVTDALGASVTQHDDDGALVTGCAAPDLSNTGGIVQGGALGWLAEFALSRTLDAVAPQLVGAQARDLRLTYLRGVPADGAGVTCRTTVQHAGSRLAAARGEVAGADGRTALLATATRYAGRP